MSLLAIRCPESDHPRNCLAGPAFASPPTLAPLLLRCFAAHLRPTPHPSVVRMADQTIAHRARPQTEHKVGPSHDCQSPPPRCCCIHETRCWSRRLPPQTTCHWQSLGRRCVRSLGNCWLSNSPPSVRPNRWRESFRWQLPLRRKSMRCCCQRQSRRCIRCPSCWLERNRRLPHKKTRSVACSRCRERSKWL